ncbi:T9SS type A sorting domain-containing protein [Puteibacter caeruleilacunae]|nr:T9SS type A sorting domain-containing protein [Puteibacter caeruleilacunae]
MTNKVHCYASNKVNKSFTPPPDEYYLKSTAENVVINVTYIDFTEQARTAFQHAVDIWSTMISSEVPIYTTARWSKLDEGVLGSAAATVSLADFGQAQFQNRFYPVALTEKMIGVEITAKEQPDIYAEFSSEIQWYYGIDGDTPTDRYDLVSVVLHELCHGLGFNGLLTVTGDNGELVGRYPGIFDEFLVNKDGEKILDNPAFPVGTVELKQQLVGSKLRFSGPMAVKSYGDLIPLYSPLIFDDGSSIYHLDEAIFKGDNALMTPFLDKGEAIHNPGDLALAMMNDIGWKSIRFFHEELIDRITMPEPAVVSATIKSDYSLKTDSIFLIYSTDDFNVVDSLLLSPTGKNDEFSAAIPVVPYGTTVKYYLSAMDDQSRIYLSPANAPQYYYSFVHGPDVVSPVIVHQPVNRVFVGEGTVELTANVTDNISVESVLLNYIINDGDVQQLTFTAESGDNYEVVIDFSSASLQDGDSIRYQIVAKDTSESSDVTIIPDQDRYYTIMVNDFLAAKRSFYSDFNDKDELILAGNLFSIEQPNGFDDPALHSPHPYESPETDGGEFEYITVIKQPVIVETGGIVEFDEIVLVEPGEENSVFGDVHFWDYVVVEGSIDKGQTWNPLADGYDSQLFSDWKELYDGGVVGNNSTSIGTKELYKHHQFDILESGDFNVGDELLVRFRLYSDPYANGWGWCIDNLSIQHNVTAEPEQIVQSSTFEVTPNPGDGMFKLHLPHLENNGVLRIFNVQGILMMEYKVAMGDHQVLPINISSYPSGVYLFCVDIGARCYVSKVLLR